MHVVALDNGTKLHVDSGSVENIDVLEQCADGDDVQDQADASPLEISGGHPSLKCQRKLSSLHYLVLVLRKPASSTRFPKTTGRRGMTL